MKAGRKKARDKKQAAAQWAIVGLLLATSAMPCPECGGPLALHIWPLLATLFVARGLAGRARPGNEREQPDEPADSDAETSPEISHREEMN